MALPQKKFREMVFQMLYSYDFSQVSEEEIVPFLMQKLAVTKKAARDAWSRRQKIVDQLPKIDALIAERSESYRFERIKTVELTILRLAIYEILVDPAIPPKVAIAEAIRLARKFSSPESASFVNALLDAIYKKHLGDTLDEAAQ
ncbi:MAG: transcription antitermination factor NusB [Waddliaceae bacterium]